jgi:hypothetical protein
VTAPNCVFDVGVSVLILHVVHDVKALAASPLDIAWEEAGSVALRFDLF